MREAYEPPLAASFDRPLDQIVGSLFRSFRCNFHVNAVRPVQDNLAVSGGHLRCFIVKFIVCHNRKTRPTRRRSTCLSFTRGRTSPPIVNHIDMSLKSRQEAGAI